MFSVFRTILHNTRFISLPQKENGDMQNPTQEVPKLPTPYVRMRNNCALITNK